MTGQVTPKPMTFEEYLDVFWDVSDNESLTETDQLAEMEKRLTEAGISKEDQDRLAGELMRSFNNPQPKQAEMTLADYRNAVVSVGRNESIPVAEKQAHLDRLCAEWGVPAEHVAKLKQQFVKEQTK
jgi:hypothetical protein